MDRAIPTSNKLISKRIDQKNREIHLLKLNTIKSSISRARPHNYLSIKDGSKRHQLEVDRVRNMEKHNKLLLDKLTDIMKPTSNGQVANQSKSLNRDYRKRELVKITIENQAIMKRLEQQKSFYNKRLWDQNRKQTETYIKNISEYPLLTTNAQIDSSEVIEF